ncbi:MAG: HEPN domain-containing protein [bacterium]
MDKEVVNWLSSARYDLETAEFMFSSGRFIYTIFMCHLALEKILKARIQQITSQSPSKTHDLGYLSDLAGIAPSPEVGKFLVEISNLGVITRYPQDFSSLLKDFHKERSAIFLGKTKEVFAWIEKSLQS